MIAPRAKFAAHPDARLIAGYNRQEAAARFRARLEASGDEPLDRAFAHWAIAYCHGADYNMYGAAYDGLKVATGWPHLPTALEHAQQAVLEAGRDGNVSTAGWTTAYMALRARFDAETRGEDGIAAYVASLAPLEGTDDCDLVALHAEAHMLRAPWALWDRATMTQTEVGRVVERLLDRGLALCPTHEWLCHLKVHCCEMGPPAQFDMRVLPPLEASESGHLRHMPSHLHIQLGDYERSMRLNREAVELDARDRARSVSPLHLYAFYECHNLHFVVFAACMCGQRAVALQYAARLSAFVRARLAEAAADGAVARRSMAFVMCEAFLMVEPMALVRFGMWRELLALPVPPEPTARLFVAYGQGIAHAALGDVATARDVAAAFARLRAESIPDGHRLHNETVANIATVAHLVLDAEVRYRASAGGGEGDAGWRASLEAAAEAEAKLAYDEPPAWMMPVRQTMGALLSERGHALDAVRCFADDLRAWPKNVWSLAGLDRALQDARASVREARRGIATDVPVEAACACATTRWQATTPGAQPPASRRRPATTPWRWAVAAAVGLVAAGALRRA